MFAFSMVGAPGLACDRDDWHLAGVLK